MDGAEQSRPHDRDGPHAHRGTQARQQPREHQREEQDARHLDQLHPVRTAEEAAAEDVGRHVRVLLHPRHDRARGGHTQIVGPGRGRADEHDAIAHRLRRDRAGQHVHRGEMSEDPTRPRIVDQHAVARIEGDRPGADEQVPTEVERQLRRLHPGRDPHRLHCQRGVVPALVLEGHRLPARGPVGVGQHRDVPQRLGRVGEARDRRRGPAGRRRRVQGPLVVVTEGHQRRLERGTRRLGRRPGSVWADLEHQRQDHPPTLAHRLRELAIVIGLTGERVELLLHDRPRGAPRKSPRPQPLRELGGRVELAAHLRLAQQDIHGDDLGAGGRELPDQVGHQRARPGPAAERGQALLVDGRDDDLLRSLRSRAPQREVQIVEPELDRLQEVGRREVHRQHQHDDGGGDQVDAGARAGEPDRHQPSRRTAAGSSPSCWITACGFTGAVARPPGVSWIASIPASRGPSTSRIGSSPTCAAS